MSYNPNQPRDPKGTETGGQWTAAANAARQAAGVMSLEQVNAKLATDGLIPLYRGTGKRGYDELAVTPGGVYGPGAYFYTDPGPSRSHASYPGGGVLVAYAPIGSVDVFGNIAVVRDIEQVVIKGKIPLQDTTLSGQDWIDRVVEVWNE